MVQKTTSASQFEDSGTDQSSKSRSRKLKFLIPLALVLAGVGVGVRYYFFSLTKETAIELSGRIEGYETDIGTTVSGRVEAITVREGDRVTNDQIIAKLDDDELQARYKASQARLKSTQQEVQQARLQIEVIQSNIRETRLSRQQAQDNAEGRIEEAQGNLDAAIAQLDQAEANEVEAQSQLQLAKADRDRFQTLWEQGVVPKQRYDQAQTEWESRQATLAARQSAVNAAQRQVKVARGTLRQAKTSSLDPEIFTERLQGLQQQLAQARSRREATQANVANAEANLEEIKAQLDDLNITSPIAGVVLDRIAEPGEVLSAGKIIVTVLDLNEVYLRGYVPEGEIGNIRVGQTANVYLDSDPNTPLDATVSSIDSEASFTPENIYFKRDRVQQVFGLKLSIDNPQGFAKPGMPADAEIILDRDTES
ncbi:secretion protein HlyD family protein [Halothece sp. PCC 7418]|uniref:HlyD family secretion protein n=1 Tax=Halothece sp. (strain PCC 7418) TaxID=65093 RepID=UPI0002A05EFA|nr:HlyD family efflux transporter periplasmic adaptor subunit [Halothece sp. PCC 7418]AFZ45765.1 secretion protein HlyD family protein [Halothece sp. PCC 7418]